jgi:arabinogalactan oligomer/maltooligosaccharide transport system substrate-binding protein
VIQHEQFIYSERQLSSEEKMTRKTFTVLSLSIAVAIIFSACTSGGRSVPTEEPVARTDEVVTTLEPSATVESIGTEEPIESEVPADIEEAMETSEPSSALACTVSLWHSFDENEMKSLNGVAAAFQEIHPDVVYDFLFTPLFDLQGKFESVAETGGGPAILIGSANWGHTFYDSSLVADISEFASDEFIATINPAALGAVHYSDALVGLPLKLDGVLMFRNASIVPEAPRSFNELVEMAQAATSGDVVGAHLEYGLLFAAGHLHALGGALLDSEGNPTFNDENGVAWAEMIKRFQDAGPVENNNDNDVNSFLEGRSGIIIDGLWNATRMAEAIGPENLVIDPWPADMSGYVQTENIYLNANLTDDALECGWAFMEFLLSPEAQQIFSDPLMAGYIPAIMGLQVSDPLQQQALEAFGDGIAYPVVPEMGEYWGPVNNALLSIVEESADPAEALQSAYNDVVDAIAENRGG